VFFTIFADKSKVLVLYLKKSGSVSVNQLTNQLEVVQTTVGAY
jgi:predicted ArsR family transcriptional regulator